MSNTTFTTPSASSVVKHGAVSDSTIGVCIDELEAKLLAARNASNHGRVELALQHLQIAADLCKELHL